MGLRSSKSDQTSSGQTPNPTSTSVSNGETPTGDTEFDASSFIKLLPLVANLPAILAKLSEGKFKQAFKKVTGGLGLGFGNKRRKRSKHTNQRKRSKQRKCGKRVSKKYRRSIKL